MNILITGGAGFVGRHFTEYFLKRGDEVYCVDNLAKLTGALALKYWYFDPNKYKNFHFFQTDCRIFFNSPQPHFDYVFHLAAMVGGRLMIENNPIAVGEDLSIDSEFWQWAVRAKPDKVITFSSSAAYPIEFQTDHSFRLLEEDDIGFDSRLGMPDMTYGWAKLTSEYLGRLAYKKYGIKSVAYRPFSGYGEDQDITYPFPNLMTKLIKSKSSLSIWGSGKQSRDFIHIDDCVRGVVTTMDKINDGDAINLSTGIYTSFLDLVEMAKNIVPHRKKVVVSPQTGKPEGVFARAGSTLKQEKLGFSAEISLEEGIRRYICAKQS